MTVISSESHSLSATVNLYDRLFIKYDPNEGNDFLANLNPNSLEILQDCRVEPSLKGAIKGNRYQFERQGYFCVDQNSANDNLVFNRTVALRDSWAKIEKAMKNNK